MLVSGEYWKTGKGSTWTPESSAQDCPCKLVLTDNSPKHGKSHRLRDFKIDRETHRAWLWLGTDESASAP